jgi:glycosyltransferase involved in cell wall biosynthesis
MLIGVDIRWLGWKGSGLYTYLSNLLSTLLHIDKENRYVFFYNEIEERIFPFHSNFSYKRVKARLFSFKETFLFFETLKKEKISLFFEPHFDLPVFLPKNLPVILTIHDLTPILFPEFFSLAERAYFWFTLRHAVKRANHIIAISNYTRYCLKKRFPQLNKVSVIYHGTPKLNYNSETYIDIPKPYIFYVGNKRGHKNYKRVIEAYKILRNRLPNYHLILLGIEGKTSDRIIFLKDVSEKQKAYLYKNAVLFVFPSLNEGFGFPILEAMQFGIPVITSHLSSVPEVTGNATYFVNPFGVDEIAEGMYKILTNHNLRKELMEKGAQRSKFFSWYETAQKYLKVFHDYGSIDYRTSI